MSSLQHVIHLVALKITTYKVHLNQYLNLLSALLWSIVLCEHKRAKSRTEQELEVNRSKDLEKQKPSETMLMH